MSRGDLVVLLVVSASVIGFALIVQRGGQSAPAVATSADETVFEINSDQQNDGRYVDVMYVVGNTTKREENVLPPWHASVGHVPPGTYLAISTQNGKSERCLDVAILHNGVSVSKARGCGPLAPVMVYGKAD